MHKKSLARTAGQVEFSCTIVLASVFLYFLHKCYQLIYFELILLICLIAFWPMLQMFIYLFQGMSGVKGMTGEKGVPGIAGPRVSIQITRVINITLCYIKIIPSQEIRPQIHLEYVFWPTFFSDCTCNNKSALC